MSKTQLDSSNLEIKIDAQYNDPDLNAAALSAKSASLNSLNVSQEYMSLSQQLNAISPNSDFSVKAKLNGLLMLSKKSSVNSLNGKQDLSRGSSLEQIDPSYLSAISSSVILTPCPSPTPDKKRIHRVVLTGGPCAGKTTSINRIRNFFENIGWKAFCVPETASVLLSSGILFYDLAKHTIKFQENLLKTLLQIEDSINEAAKFYHNEKNQNCIIIYDRGAMDPVAYLSAGDWETLKSQNPTWNEVDLRDNRYDQILHLITAANGAEQFYVLDNNACRTEDIEIARQIDERCAKVWVGHPYIDVIDNCTEFEMKVARVLQAVCDRVGLQIKGFDVGNRKRKFLVKTLPDLNNFPTYQDFNVVHNYLASSSPKIQARIRKRGQSNVWSYTYTVRTKEDNQTVETRTQIDKREYGMLLKTIDTSHYTIYKLRRCFEWRHRYYQLDIYEEPCNPCCRGLAILTTHCMDQDLLLPNFIEIQKEITDDPFFSMFNLSLRKTKV